MKALGRWALVVAVAIAVVVGVLYVAVPPNRTAQEGPPDPILSVRRPVIKALIWAGIVEGPGWFGGHPYLPTIGGSEGFEPTTSANEQGPPAWRMEIEMEPVYRGIFWPVGDRITYRRRLFGENRESWRSIRLCYAEGDREHVAGTNDAPEPQLAEVTGYVPRSARGYWVESTDDKGVVHSMDGWGDTDPFFDD